MKCTLTIIQAHNGAEILTLTPAEYVHTKFDDIIADWKRQQIKEHIQQRKEDVKISNIILKAAKKIWRMI